jgi:subtilisin family serine protease
MRYLRPGEYVPDEIIVMPRKGLDPDDLDQSLENIHGHIKKTISDGTLVTYVVQVDKKEFSSAFYALKKDQNFNVVQCNLIARQQSAQFPEGPPNDPDYSQQYHIGLCNINKGWQDYGTGYGVTVGIIDSGVNGEQTDLTGRVESGLNVITRGPANHDTSSTGHGTAVATLMAAGTNNDILGTAPGFGVAIVPTDVFNGSQTTTDSDVIAAYAYLETQNVRLINLSINNAAPNSYNNQSAHPALWTYFRNFWTNHNGMTINSTPDNGALDSSPRSQYLIVVSAIDSSSHPAIFSDFGPGISFAAPGVSVGTSGKSSTFGFYSGTSFACPLLTGVIAMVMGNYPQFSNQQIYNKLITAVTQPPQLHEPYPLSYYYGYGIINADKLMKDF